MAKVVELWIKDRNGTPFRARPFTFATVGELLVVAKIPATELAEKMGLAHFAFALFLALRADDPTMTPERAGAEFTMQAALECVAKCFEEFGTQVAHSMVERN